MAATTTKNFWKTFRLFRSFDLFLKNRSCRCDSITPKIVIIGVILAIFRPFEDFGGLWFIIEDMDPWIHRSAAGAAAKAAAGAGYVQ